MNRKRSIPDHELLGSIGTGSYGTVWLARSVLGTYRAVKIIEREAFKDESAFEREFAGLQRYEPVSREHEGFVDILHVGRNDKAGFFYYVMELADNEFGGDPDDAYGARTLTGKRFSTEECLQLGLALASALDQLHGRGLVHRDIKPANIIFINGVPKLADIGLVAQAGNTTFVGTEGYIPKEGPGTPDADLYALGKVLYVVSTGNDCLKFPEAPTDADRIVLQFQAVIQRACATDARHRYKSAAEMHADLTRLQRGSAPRLAASSTHNLPEPLTSFIGREKELAEIRQLLETNRLLTLTGVGGCGKTRLAIEVGRQVLEKVPDGVWLVELASVADAALVPKSVAAALRLQEERNRSPLATLTEFLRDREMLLLVDNCEHLIDACARLTDTLLKECPGLRILATGREPLGITGEAHRFVPSLSEAESVRLFVERVRAVLPGFELTAVNGPIVTEICARLDGIPLAIELAAARARAMSVEQIAQRLNDRFRFLTGGSRTALARQQTLQATIDWSFNLLSEAEAALFCRLAVFAGGWTLEAAEAVCGGGVVDEAAVLDLLTRLVDKSLVLAEPRGQTVRYRMLETVRQYSQDRLVQSGQLKSIRDAHLKVYFGLVEEVDSQSTAYAPKEWLDRLESELENLRAALAWALETEPLEALRMASRAEDFWATRAHYSEGRQWLDRALTLAANAPAADRALALEVAGRLAWCQADCDRAFPLLEECLQPYRQLGNEAGAANALRLTGNCHSELPDYHRAFPFYEESLALYRKCGMQWGVSSILNNLANLAERDGDLAKARALYEECVASDRAANDRQGSIVPLYNLGELSIKEGDCARAREYFLESLRLSHNLSHQRAIAYNLEGLAKVACLIDQPEHAVQLCSAAEAIRQRIGTPLPLDSRPDYDRYLARARSALSPDAFNEAWTHGKNLSVDEVVASAIQPPK